MLRPDWISIDNYVGKYKNLSFFSNLSRIWAQNNEKINSKDPRKLKILLELSVHSTIIYNDSRKVSGPKRKFFNKSLTIIFIKLNQGHSGPFYIKRSEKVRKWQIKTLFRSSDNFRAFLVFLKNYDRSLTETPQKIWTVFLSWPKLVSKFVNQRRKMRRFILTKIKISIILWNHVDIMKNDTVPLASFSNFLKTRIHNEAFVKPPVVHLFDHKNAIVNFLTL